jgi:hypothetical protein
LCRLVGASMPCLAARSSSRFRLSHPAGQFDWIACLRLKIEMQRRGGFGQMIKRNSIIRTCLPFKPLYLKAYRIIDSLA